MLLSTKSCSYAVVIRDFVNVPIIECCVDDLDVPREHLVMVATQTMGLSSLLKCSSEVELRQLLDDKSHVVIEVTTEHDRSVGVLKNDSLDDISDPLRTFFKVWLFSRFEVAVHHLYVRVAQLVLGPAEICSQCLHQRKSGVSSSSCPYSAITLCKRLV